VKRFIAPVIAAALTAVAVLALPASADQTVTTANGTWTVYPGQSVTNQVAVQQPINADGSSVFKNTKKAVIPVKFALSQGLGAFTFQSIGSDTSTANDYSYASFAPAAPITFSQLTDLESVYSFAAGNCHGGSLRWQVALGGTGNHVFIYYGDGPNFTDCTTNNQSNVNMIGLSDLRYDTSQLPGGTFYDNYAHALSAYGSMSVDAASLVVDSGWGGDQIVNLSSATVGTASYSDTFTPSGSVAPSPTCTLPTASIKVTKISGSDSGSVDEVVTIQPADDNGVFRQVDCKYMYNLATGSLRGAGVYTIQVVIGGTPAAGSATFTLQ
jgi:hypothetical protein